MDLVMYKSKCAAASLSSNRTSTIERTWKMELFIFIISLGWFSGVSLLFLVILIIMWWKTGTYISFTDILWRIPTDFPLIALNLLYAWTLWKYCANFFFFLRCKCLNVIRFIFRSLSSLPPSLCLSLCIYLLHMKRLNSLVLKKIHDLFRCIYWLTNFWCTVLISLFFNCIFCRLINFFYFSEDVIKSFRLRILFERFYFQKCAKLPSYLLFVKTFNLTFKIHGTKFESPK